MNTTRVKSRLYGLLGDEVIQALKESEAMIAGGAFTSLFTNTDINDFDIYFRSAEKLKKFIDIVYGCDPDDSTDMEPFQVICNAVTDRSILMKYNDEMFLQAIYFSFYEKPEDIFDSFDFTVNMCAYDFSTEEFVYNQDFIVDLAQRKLTVNPKTNYPIISMQRVNKYISRGYSISKKEMFKLGMAVAELQLDSWDSLKDQLNGFYGLDINEVFKEVENIEFSMDKAYDVLNDINEFAYNIDRDVDYNKIVDVVYTKFDLTTSLKYYKVLTIDNNKEHTSLYYKNFKWNIGELHDGGECGIWTYYSYNEAKDMASKGQIIAEVVPENGVKITYDHRSRVARVFGKVRLINATIVE